MEDRPHADTICFHPSCIQSSNQLFNYSSDYYTLHQDHPIEIMHVLNPFFKTLTMPVKQFNIALHLKQIVGSPMKEIEKLEQLTKDDFIRKLMISLKSNDCNAKEYLSILNQVTAKQIKKDENGVEKIFIKRIQQIGIAMSEKMLDFFKNSQIFKEIEGSFQHDQRKEEGSQRKQVRKQIESSNERMEDKRESKQVEYDPSIPLWKQVANPQLAQLLKQGSDEDVDEMMNQADFRTLNRQRLMNLKATNNPQLEEALQQDALQQEEANGIIHMFRRQFPAKVKETKSCGEIQNMLKCFITNGYGFASFRREFPESTIEKKEYDSYINKLIRKVYRAFEKEINRMQQGAMPKLPTQTSKKLLSKLKNYHTVLQMYDDEILLFNLLTYYIGIDDHRLFIRQIQVQKDVAIQIYAKIIDFSRFLFEQEKKNLKRKLVSSYTGLVQAHSDVLDILSMNLKRQSQEIPGEGVRIGGTGIKKQEYNSEEEMS